MNIQEMRVRGKRVGDITYRYAPGLWVVTAYYNPMGYQSRRLNYEIFALALRQSGIPLLTVECAFGDQPFNLPESADVIRARSESLLWQKERLIGNAIPLLPASCTAVSWQDCDLLFANPRWAQETVSILEESAVVQVFETCNRLPQNYAEANAEGDICDSFAKRVGQNPAVLKTGRYDDHGHTGYGWAARRDVLDAHGLYEYAIAGSADHYMAHAAMGDTPCPCTERLMLRQPSLVQHFQDWAEPFHGSVRGKLRAVSGEVLHLWHGDLKDRKYMLRHMEFADFGFNPYTDLVAPPGKPLELRKDLEKPGLREWFASYFAKRQEDGAQPLAA